MPYLHISYHLGSFHTDIHVNIFKKFRQSWTKFNETPHVPPPPCNVVQIAKFQVANFSLVRTSVLETLDTTLAGGKGGQLKIYKCLINFVQDCLKIRKKIEKGCTCKVQIFFVYGSTTVMGDNKMNIASNNTYKNH